MAAWLLALSLLAAVPDAGTADDDIAALDLGTLLDTPISSVSRVEERSAEAPAATFVLTAEDLERQGFRTLDEALRSVPGLFTVDDTIFESIGVRGLQVLGDYNSRVLVMVDGHPLNNQVGTGQSYVGRDLPVTIPAIERIEVIKGPVGGVWGPSAYFAVVNVVTKSASRNAGAVSIAGEATESRPNAAEISGAYGREVGEFGFTVHANYYRSRGFDYSLPTLDRPVPPDGLIREADMRQAINAYGTLNWRNFKLAVGFFDRLKGMPTAPYGTIPGDQRGVFSDRALFAQLSWDKAISDIVQVYARLAFDAFWYRDELPYLEPPADGGLFVDIGNDRWFSGEARVTLKPFKGHRDLIGIELQNHSTLQHSFYASDEKGTQEIARDFTTVNAYLLVEQRFADVLAMQVGLTFYAHALFGSRVTPKVSVVLTPTKNDVLKVLYSEGFRPPTMFESYFDDGLDFVANPGLKPETARSFELSWEHRFADVFALSGSLFINDYQSLILSTTVPAPDLGREPDPNEPTDFRQQYQNSGTIHLMGGEIGASLGSNRYLRAWGGVSFQHADFGQGAVAGGFAKTTGNLALSSNAAHPSVTIAARMAVVDRRDKDVPNVVEGEPVTVDPYLWADLSVRWAIPWVKGLATQLSVYNLFNVAAFDPLVADHAPLTQVKKSPREFRLKVEYAF